MVYRGRVRGGVIVLDAPAQIPEGTVVNVETIPAVESPGHPADDPFYHMDELAVETGVSDLATNIDHYLYGHPRVDDAS
jgi:hypothetical protein